MLACEPVAVGARLRAMFVQPPGSIPKKPRSLLCLVGLAIVVLSLLSCVSSPGPDGASAQAGNLLASAQISDSSGVSRPARVTDGVVARDGDEWRTNVTTLLQGTGAFIEYDLGKTTPIRALLLQGDANDSYIVTVSEDGKNFKHLWTARPVRASGMQTRHAPQVEGQGRYLRVQGRGGDGKFSMAELAAYAEQPAVWPPQFRAEHGTPLEKSVERRVQLFGLLAVLFLLLNHRKAPIWIKALAAVPVGAGIYAGVQLSEMWPLEEGELTLLRAVIAVVAAVAVFRHYFPGKDAQQDTRWTNTTLALLAVLAVGCFYHFGMPQFRDEAKGRQTLVHPWDMRVYFPVVKYFDELHFDGLYLASLAAYLDNNPNVTPASIQNVRLRDLTDNEMRRAGDVQDQIQEVKKRFTPARWEEFRRDMQYFQDLMGAGGYLGSLRDHGGNATPVWILGAYVFWAHAPANELTLTLTGLLDPLLLILMLVMVGRTFGWRAMLIAAIAFGTTDLSRFGTNLMGSTLRLDWMIAVGFGAVALYRKRWLTGGALLAYAGLIRGFPGLSVIFLGAPALVWLFEWIREKKSLPSIATIRTEHRSYLLAGIGATACVVLLFGLSSAVFGYQASWGNWFAKIRIHQDKPNVNHVGLRNVLSYESEHIGKKVMRNDLDEPWTDWQHTQLAAFHRRKPIYYATIALFTGLVIAASRRRKLHQTALMGMLLIPIFFYPANYYCHFVFLLPLLAVDRKETNSRLFGWVSIVVLAMSGALYLTLREHEVDVRYTLQSDVILAAFLLILAPMAYFAWRPLPEDAEPKPQPDVEPEPVAAKEVEAEPKPSKKRKKKTRVKKDEEPTAGESSGEVEAQPALADEEDEESSSPKESDETAHDDQTEHDETAHDDEPKD